MQQKIKSGLGEIINHILQSQAIMKRSKLKIKANNTKLLIDIGTYKYSKTI